MARRLVLRKAPQLVTWAEHLASARASARKRCADMYGSLKGKAAAGRPAQTHIHQHRLEHATHSLNALAWISLAVAVFAMKRIWDGDSDFFNHCLYAGSYAIVLALQLSPSWLVMRRIHILFSLFMAAITVAILSCIVFQSCDYPCEAQMVFMVVRLYLGFWVSDMHLAAIWNIVCAAVTCVSSMAREEADHGYHGPVYEVCLTLLILMLICDRERMGLDKMQLETQLRACRARGSAATNLLDAVYDVVVPLSEELKITEHVPKLANMLLHNPAQNELRGMEFHGFISSELEQQTFKQFATQRLQPAANRKQISAIAEIFYTNLQDSAGNQFGVELFDAHFLDSSDTMNHLVGIRELFDEEQNPRGLPQSRAWVTPYHVDPARGQPKSLCTSSSATGDDTIFAMFNALSPNMEFTYMSPSWIARFGDGLLVGEDSVADWMHPEVVGDFRAWLQPHVNRALNNWSRVTTISFGRVQSLDPQTGQPVRAVLRVSLLDPQEMSTAAMDSYLVKLSVCHIRSLRNNPRTPNRSLPSIPEENERTTHTSSSQLEAI